MTAEAMKLEEIRRMGGHRSLQRRGLTEKRRRIWAKSH